MRKSSYPLAPMFSGRASVALVLLLAAAAGCTAPVPQRPPADLVLLGGTIVTLDPQRPRAAAIAVSDFRIAAVGSDEEIRAFAGEATEVIDLRGRLVIPGFIEGHGHFLALGQSRTILDLTTATSWDDIVAMVAEKARSAQPGTWILGRGWHQEKWNAVPPGSVDGVPPHAALSAVSPDNPVRLTHASGHSSIVNAKAMELSGITAATADPDGGTIVKDARGRPTGLLRETAQRLVGDAIAASRQALSPETREAELRTWVRLAGEEALAKGVTSFQDAGSSFEEIDLFRAMAAEGALPVRLYVMVRRESNDDLEARLDAYRIIPKENDFIAVRSIKRQIDGALGAHGAWLFAPYEDLPQSAGLNLEPIEEIERTARIAIAKGFQVNTHAIGDRANREILDLYERVFVDNPGAKDLRWRVEHAQHLHPDDVPRFARLGVIASMQGVHCTSDGPWVPKRLGEARTAQGAYLWRALLDAGATVINGTDVPVEDIDPIASYYASVTRMMKDQTAFHPAQVMTREEALRSYTLDAAHAAFEEDLKGSLQTGKLADIVVLSRDIMTIPAEEIRSAQVDLTIIGGKVRFTRDERLAPSLQATRSQSR